MANTKRRCGCGHWIADHYSYNGCSYFHCSCTERPTTDDIKRECNSACRASITSRKKCHCICGGSLHGAEYSDATLIALNQ